MGWNWTLPSPEGAPALAGTTAAQGGCFLCGCSLGGLTESHLHMQLSVPAGRSLHSSYSPSLASFLSINCHHKFQPPRQPWAPHSLSWALHDHAVMPTCRPLCATGRGFRTKAGASRGSLLLFPFILGLFLFRLLNVPPLTPFWNTHPNSSPA